MRREQRSGGSRAADGRGPMLELSGRLAVVTGASRGIGAAVAEALHGAGASVVRLARSLVERDGRGDRWVDLPCDLTQDGELARAAARIMGRGVPDLVVNGAGAFAYASFETTGVDTLDALYRANLRTPFAVARAFLPAMRRAGRGRHVLLGSVADHRAFANNAAYGATKHGVRGLHEVLREEYRGTGVLCTLVSPGPVDTPLWDPVAPDTRPELLPRRAMLRPGDVAEAILFVATRSARVDVEWIRLGPAAQGPGTRDQGPGPAPPPPGPWSPVPGP